MQLAQVNPEVLDIVDVDKAGSTISDRLGAPADMLLGDEQVGELRQARQQQQQHRLKMDRVNKRLQGAQQVAELEQTGQWTSLVKTLRNYLAAKQVSECWPI